MLVNCWRLFQTWHTLDPVPPDRYWTKVLGPWSEVRSKLPFTKWSLVDPVDLLISPAPVSDPTMGMEEIRIVMGAMKQPTLVIPDVFAVNENRLARSEPSHRTREIDVVGYEEGLSVREFDEKLLVSDSFEVARERGKDRRPDSHEEFGLTCSIGACEATVACGQRCGLGGLGHQPQQEGSQHGDFEQTP